MSRPQCKSPVCIYNCCSKQGTCPSSASGCYKQKFSNNPIWIYVAIGLLVLLIIAGSITLLIVMKRRRERLRQENTVVVEQPGEQKGIEMSTEVKQEVPIPPVNKKNIYVYDREVSEGEKGGRPLSSSLSSSRSKKSRGKQQLSNPFQKRRFLREPII